METQVVGQENSIPYNEFDFAPVGNGATVAPVEMEVEQYVMPVASTDYYGLASLDPRLADRVWRLNNLYTVINEEGELVKFKLRQAQEELLNGMHYKNIILKARQLGFTTFICIFLLDYALFNRNKQVGIIGPTQTDTSVIFRKIKVAWENFPQKIKDFMNIQTKGDSKVEYEFSNGSIMRVSTSLRSGTYQAVLITEFGKICAHFPEKAEEIITGTLPAVPAKGLVFIESTAEGEDGDYYQMVQDSIEIAESKRALTIKDYKFFFFPWYKNPADIVEGPALPITQNIADYLDEKQKELGVVFSTAQKNWYWLEARMQKDKMKQEHPTDAEEAFLTSGNKLFNAELLKKHEEEHSCDPVEEQGDFRIFRYYTRGHLYVLGADVSQGVKRDSSTICVIDITTSEVVLTYKSSKIDPVSFAHEIKKAGLMYGACLAAPEANNVGLTTCVQLNQIYPNVYTQVREGMIEDHPTQKLGYLTGAGNKPKMMYELSDAIEHEELKVLDASILHEGRKFNKEDTLSNTVTTSTTRHFDLLMAAAIAWQVRGYATKGLADPEEVARVENHRAEITNRKKGSFR